MRKPKDLGKEEREAREVYRSTFSTPAGQKVLADLKDLAGGALIGQDAHITVVRAAQREMLDYIEDMTK